MAKIVKGGYDVFDAGRDVILGVLGRSLRLVQIALIEHRHFPRVVKSDLGVLMPVAFINLLDQLLRAKSLRTGSGAENVIAVKEERDKTRRSRRGGKFIGALIALAGGCYR